MIQVKNSDILFTLLKHRYDPKLCLLIKYLADIAGIFITEGQRKKTHKNDLHGTVPVRAIDGRASIYTHPAIVADRINAKWVYDPDRPDMKCAVYHARCPYCKKDYKHVFVKFCKECGHDITDHWHIHFQCHPRTVFLKDGKK